MRFARFDRVNNAGILGCISSYSRRRTGQSSPKDDGKRCKLFLRGPLGRDRVAARVQLTLFGEGAWTEPRWLGTSAIGGDAGGGVGAALCFSLIEGEGFFMFAQRRKASGSWVTLVVNPGLNLS